MKIDLYLKNARIFDIAKQNVEPVGYDFEIVKGEQFSLLTDAPAGTRIFSSNDEVLTIKQSGTTFEISADNLGDAILVYTAATDFNPLKVVKLQVIDEIVQPAVSLNLTPGTPETK